MQGYELVNWLLILVLIVQPVLWVMAVGLTGLALYLRFRGSKWCLASGLGALLFISALWLTGCYIEKPQTSCPQYDPSTQSWVDRCAQ